MRRWLDSEMKSNKIKLFFMIITNLVSAENLDLSQPWESNDSYIFLSQLDNVIAESIETLPNFSFSALTIISLCTDFFPRIKSITPKVITMQAIIIHFDANISILFIEPYFN